jgi:hypothetical protein
MDIDFANVWKVVGWMDFVNVSELGFRDLTIQFLCTLIEENDGISFHGMNTPFLGRNSACFWVFITTAILIFLKLFTVLKSKVSDSPFRGRAPMGNHGAMTFKTPHYV